MAKKRPAPGPSSRRPGQPPTALAPAGHPRPGTAPTGGAARPGGAPDDQDARDRIEREFHKNFLVEAGAGSGKTRSLARRMAAGIAAGVYRVEHMAAVTFTRKAAAELRGRFQEALEDRLRGCPDKEGRPTHVPTADERARLEDGLRDIERLFAGTIHAFCAHLLRERPVEARIAPGFTELDEVEDLRRRKQAWREYVARERALGSVAMLELQAAGVRPQDLDKAFAVVCEHQDVHFPAGDAAMPATEPAWKALEAFWPKIARLIPAAVDPKSTCKVLELARDFGTRFDYARRWKRQPATLAEFLNDWRRGKVTQKSWHGAGAEAKSLHDAFKEEVAEPFVQQWRQYVYRLAITVLTGARAFYAGERRRANVVNYVDLLLVTAQLLRGDAAVRRALQHKYRWFFIDEFQDTDPVQAEIFLLLAETGTVPFFSSEEAKKGTVPISISAPLRPGSLFVVGDPKQSIYRFRRADIDIYNRVRERIAATGGEVLHLTANWRSLPGVCTLANSVFATLFPSAATRESPAFEPLDPQRPESQGPRDTPRLARLVVPGDVGKTDTAGWEAERIARYIKTEVAAGRRRWGSFLVLTRYKPRLAAYAEALDQLEIPVEVSGAGRFGGSPQVEALAQLLGSLADPLDGAALVGVLRGPLFGLSDPELFAFRAAGGRFELAAPLLGSDADRLLDLEREMGTVPIFSSEGAKTGTVPISPRASALSELARYLDTRYGPVLPALRRLRAWRHLARQLPLGAAVDRILEESGFLALAATSPGGAKAGDLLQAVDYVRQVVESGGGLAEAADALVEDDEVATDVETLPLEPGKRDVVRLMNLHKAKGLEADVVFLADPAHGKPFGVDVRIVRDTGDATGGPRARGYLKVERSREGKNWRITLGEPEGWDDHEAAEKVYLQAEINRLLYVAATRVRDRLVVGQWAKTNARGQSQNEAWGEFDGFLAGVGELQVPAQAPSTQRPAVDVSPDAREAVRALRETRHAGARQASWQVTSVTGEHTPARTRAARVREALGLEPGVSAIDETGPSADVPETTPAVAVLATAPSGGATAPGQVVAPLASETPTDRADIGAAWGSLIHGLLEHAMRHPAATRDDLARLAKWLTVEHEDLRPAIPEALGVVEAVSKADVWQEAREAGAERHVEVPFAIRIEPGALATRAGEAGPGTQVETVAEPGGAPSPGVPGAPGAGAAPPVPTVLRGVIDLVYRAADGWRILDYKTDLVESGVAELLARHGPQLTAYVSAWRQATGETPARAGIFGVRDLQVGWTEGDEA